MYKILSVVGSIAAWCAVVEAFTNFSLDDDFSVDYVARGVGAFCSLQNASAYLARKPISPKRDSIALTAPVAWWHGELILT